MKLINNDCLDILDQMITNGEKVDAIITSPPYNMNLRIMKGKYVSRCRNKNHFIEFSNKYDNFTDDLTMEEYFNTQDEFLSKALQVTDLVFYNIQMVKYDGPKRSNKVKNGSCGVASKELGRDFIGIELDENYYNLAKERIENT